MESCSCRPVFARGEDDKAGIGREAGPGGNGPLLGEVGIIAQSESREVERSEIGIVNFNPITRVAVFVV